MKGEEEEGGESRRGEEEGRKGGERKNDGLRLKEEQSCLPTY